MNTLIQLHKLISKPAHVIKYSDTIESAIKIMLDRNLSTCPVVDASGSFRGQISDAILIKGIILIRSNIKIKLVYDLRRFLLKPPTVSKTASLEEIIKKIFISQSQRVFVLDSKESLMGIISPKEVLEMLSKDLISTHNRKINKNSFKKSKQIIKILEKL